MDISRLLSDNQAPPTSPVSSYSVAQHHGSIRVSYELPPQHPATPRTRPAEEPAGPGQLPPLCLGPPLAPLRAVPAPSHDAANTTQQYAPAEDEEKDERKAHHQFPRPDFGQVGGRHRQRQPMDTNNPHGQPYALEPPLVTTTTTIPVHPVPVQWHPQQCMPLYANASDRHELYDVLQPQPAVACPDQRHVLRNRSVHSTPISPTSLFPRESVMHPPETPVFSAPSSLPSQLALPPHLAPIFHQEEPEEAEEMDVVAPTSGPSLGSPPSDRPYHCTVDGCDATFGQKGSLTRHMKNRHSSNCRPHACDLCDKTFSEKWTLNVHRRNVHLKLKAHNCEFCNKSFGEKWNLRKHVNVVHLHVKPFTCHICDRAFGYKGDMVKHVTELHSTPSALRPFKCEAPGCGVKFARMRYLRRHQNLNHKNAAGDGMDSTSPSGMSAPLPPPSSSFSPSPPSPPRAMEVNAQESLDLPSPERRRSSRKPSNDEMGNEPSVPTLREAPHSQVAHNLRLFAAVASRAFPDES